MPKSSIRHRAHERLLLVATLLATSCTTEGESAPPRGESTPPPCEAPGRLVDDGRCLAPGVQDNDCEAGTVALDDGSCEPVGVPESACGKGFAPRDRGCDAILPETGCARGMMAVPGDSACREIARCGAAPWGDIAVDAATQYVDAAFKGASDGSATKPDKTIQEGVDAAAAGAVVAIAAGRYPENITLSARPIRLWGRCPSMVEVVGQSSSAAAVLIRDGGSGSPLRSLAVTGASNFGVAISGANKVALQQLWFHEVLVALDIEDTFGPAEASLQGSLIEQSLQAGVVTSGAALAIVRSTVRATQAYASEGNAGLFALKGASLNIDGSRITGNATTGLMLDSSEVVVTASVISDTVPNLNGLGGAAIHAQPVSKSDGTTRLTLRGSLIEGNRSVGIVMGGTEALIEYTTIRNTLPVGPSNRRHSEVGKASNSTPSRAERHR